MPVARLCTVGMATVATPGAWGAGRRRADLSRLIVSLSSLTGRVPAARTRGWSKNGPVVGQRAITMAVGSVLSLGQRWASTPSCPGSELQISQLTRDVVPIVG